ncbi:MAG: amino acid ABC transporter ATP-binding protein [Actinomycetes bacterium]
MTTPMLEVKNLRKSYGADLVLHDISVALAEHEVKVLVGASGSGKSTLLRAINLLEGIDDGQILLDGQDITAIKVNPDEIRAQIGSVFQSFNLFPHLNVLQNITLAPRKVHGVAKDEAEANAMQMLERFGLADKAKQYPDLLSGGQQQRVAILRAVITKPKVLLLDEVTSALDPILIAEVLALISELKGEGMTMMIATHEMGFAKRVADQVLFLHQGQIVEAGSAREILEDPKTPELQNFLSALREAGRL